MALNASEVAALLVELSRRTAIAGGNPYRARAYGRAAESLATLTMPLAVVVEERRLRAIPGIGETIADIVEKLHRTGNHSTLEKLRQEIPAGVIEMLSIPGLRRRRYRRSTTNSASPALTSSRRRRAPTGSRR